MKNFKTPTTAKIASIKSRIFSKLSFSSALIMILALFLSLSSCKKAVETFNMIGTWEVDSYTENGVDKTTFFKNTFVDYRIKFDASKNFLETSKVAGVDVTNGGSWKILSGGGSLELTYLSDGSVRVLKTDEIKRTTAIITETAGNKVFNLRKI